MLTTPVLDRAGLVEWYRANRRRSAELFALIDEGAFYDRPIPLRHPFAFYEGHLPAFSFLTLNERSLGEAPVDAQLERLFERGIDPADVEDARRHEREDWPSRAAVAAFAAECDRKVIEALLNARIDDPSAPRLARAQAAYTVLEHEMMHHETLLYIVNRLDTSKKGRVEQRHMELPIVGQTLREVPGGIATIGANPDEIAFGWDNEFGRIEVPVTGFAILTYPVTNGDWLAFLADGGPVPPFWTEREGEWYVRGLFEDVPLPLSWPVYVSHRQAQAYADWSGTRLPTEAEYHRAAFGSPAGTERPFPWGSEAPAPPHGNFGFQRYDPEPVNAHPAGASAWGIQDLVGNGWEWTSTQFGPLPGFEPMASYPQYSADFFDGKHYVMKGASPVTAAALIRRSLRNWFYDDYPYMFAKFRTVAAR
jgi:gamma-glutamyl hercynylcysteine S-oxide synthase